MGIIEKQSIRNLVLTYLGVGLGFISTLYLFPFILTTEEYGLTRILLSIAFIDNSLFTVRVSIVKIPLSALITIIPYRHSTYFEKLHILYEKFEPLIEFGIVTIIFIKSFVFTPVKSFLNSIQYIVIFRKLFKI